MKRGVNKDALAASLAKADQVFLYQPDSIDWSVKDIASQCHQPADTSANVDELVAKIVSHAQAGSYILVMSNGGFEGIHGKLLEKLGEE
jgi:UDP-N-acetylmuramate: L-alanyl-gamma-D-glutamyl-meso-diaminopimelate ligase